MARRIVPKVGIQRSLDHLRADQGVPLRTHASARVGHHSGVSGGAVFAGDQSLPDGRGPGACRELAPSKQESTTYEPSPVCKLLILGCRLLIPDRLLAGRAHEAAVDGDRSVLSALELTVPLAVRHARDYLFGLPVSMSMREVEGSNFQGHHGDLVYARRNIQEGAFDAIDASPRKIWDINLEIGG